MFQRPFKGFCKTVKKRTTDARMKWESESYLSKLKDFPSVKSVNKLKNIVDGVEIKLRGGSVVSDYGGAVKGSLKAWDAAGKTTTQTVNVLGETAVGTHALGEAIAEWQKGHYFCCVCSGIACSCFYVKAAASLIPGGMVFGKE